MQINKDTLPYLTLDELHPDTEISNDDFNSYFIDIEKDINNINLNINEYANNCNNLMNTIKLKFNNIKTILETEKERQEDINILCNKYTNFSNVILINNDLVDSTLNFKKELNCYLLPTTSEKKVSIDILDIIGNGYEGNKYVYKNDKFENEILDTSNRKYITDANVLTYYEYSRITSSNSETQIFNDVNFDSISSKCSILIHSENAFNSLQITSDFKDLTLDSISISNDNQNYRKCNINNVRFIDTSSKYNNADYIYGTGLLSFEDSNYVKIILKSESLNNNKSEEIAFVKKNIDNEENIVKIATGKRSIIRLNDITASKKKYKRYGSLMLKNFVSSKITSIAIFANEYAPDNIDLRSSIKYILTINGTDYEIIPINSGYDGKKIIRTTSLALPTDYVHYINEDIKSASLTINLSTNNEYSTPYISNLKILVGND